MRQMVQHLMTVSSRRIDVGQACRERILYLIELPQCD